MRKHFSSVVGHLQILSAVVLATTAVACSGDSPRATPTSPTTGGAGAPAPGITGATVTGTVATGLSASALAPAAVGLTISVEGTSLTTTANGSGAFTLTGVPAGTVMLHFSGPGADARLEIDDVTEQETIELHVRVNGSQVDVDDKESKTPDNRLEIEGRVTEMTKNPNTLKVRNTTVLVPDGITIRHGSTQLTFNDLKVNDLVHIKATSTGPTTATAQEIMMQTDHGNPGGGDNGNDNEVELTGTVSGKAGACTPSVTMTFKLGTTQVTTNGSTKFEDTTCATLANGDRVEVKGTRQSATAILATKVSKED